MSKVRVSIGMAIPQDDMCSFEYDGNTIAFRAPIDLRPLDEVAVDTRDGQIHAVNRVGLGLVWYYQPPPSSEVITVRGTWEGDLDLDALIGGLL